MRKKNTASKSSIIQALKSIQKRAVKSGATLTFIVCFVAAAIIAALFHYFLMSDFYASNDQLRVKVEAKEKENYRGRLVEQSEPAFRAEFRQLISLSEELRPLLPEETDLSEILAGVQEMARREGVMLTGLNATKDSISSPGADKLFEREMPVQVSGNSIAVARFFYQLARLPRIVVVRDFEMLAGRDNEATANFTLACFHAPPPNAPNQMPPLPDFIKKAPQTASAQ